MTKGLDDLIVRHNDLHGKTVSTAGIQFSVNDNKQVNAGVQAGNLRLTKRNVNVTLSFNIMINPRFKNVL